MAAGGRATDCGVMNRGAGLGGSTGAAGCVLATTEWDTGGAGRGGTAEGGATVGRAAGEVA